MTVTVESLVAQVEQPLVEWFSPTRYPYTYAADFLRNNTNVVPLEVRDAFWADTGEVPSLMSRAQASRMRQRWAAVVEMDDADLARVLADAYLVVNHIQKPGDAQ